MNALEAATGRDDFRVAVVLGSGMSTVARELLDFEPIPYSAIEGMPVATVEGHAGSLYHGELDGVPVMMFAGRAHLYEGHSARDATFAVREAVLLGCKTVILTNAVGAIDPSLEVGAPCLISDHLNLTGTNPLAGPHDGLGPRFPDMSTVYTPALRDLAREIDPSLRDTVFCQLLGPSYETPAEIRSYRTLGADTVGMSTAIEAIVAHYLQAAVLGISLVTNLAAGVTYVPLTHEEVTHAADAAIPRMRDLLRGVIARL